MLYDTGRKTAGVKELSAFWGGGKRDGEGGALPQDAVDLHLSAIQGDDFTHDVQSQSRAGPRFPGGEERIEDFREVVFRNAGTGILDDDGDHALSDGGGKRQRSPALHRLDSIGQKMEEDLQDSFRFAADGRDRTVLGRR